MATAVGRERELEQVASFLDLRGGTRVLLLEGEPGIGKTTVWEEAVGAAQPDWRVVRARPLEAEARISFAAVGDLLAGTLDEVRADVPAPQLHALEVALLLADPGKVSPDPQAIAFAFLSALRVLARSRPLLVAVDDVQWLDQPSAAVIVYAARRVEEATVRFLFARRTQRESLELEIDRAVGSDGLTRLALGPLSRGAIQRLLHERLDVVVSRPALHQIHAASAGNPFYALELARSIPEHAHGETPGAPLRIPDSLSSLVDERLARLPRTTERALQIAALLAQPTVDSVTAVLGREPSLRPGIEAGVVVVDGGAIAFTHPLLASGLAARIDPGRVRELHRRIAAVVSDPEEHARHLAQGASGADSEAVAALDRAAEHARSRGAPEVAAELLERGLRLTAPSDSGRVRRLLAAADAQRTAGDFARSRELASEAVDALPPGEDRARALLALAEASPEPAEIAATALAEAGSDHALRARISLSLGLGYLGIDCRRALEHARSAADDAEAAGDAPLAAEALAFRAWFEGACCDGDPLASIRRAAELERASSNEVVTGFRPAFADATIRMWRDEHDPARAGFADDFEAAAQRGDSFRRMHALMHLAQVEWRAGTWDRAVEHGDAALTEWRDSGDPQGVGAALWIRAVIAAHRGDLVVARDSVAEALAPGLDDRLHLPRHAWILGFAALSEDDPQRALPHLEAAARGFDDLGIVEPGMRLFTGDLIEAYVATGRLEDAAAYAAASERRGVELGRPRAVAIGLRGRGLALTADGDLEGALALLEQAVLAGEGWPVPLERGRTLLALGTVQRRLRRRREARATLEQAATVFEELGAQPFLDRTRAELGRIGGRAPSAGGLTATEQRVAGLVAEGKTNREVAGELVLSVHTVEAALTAIYRKLEVRSRTELARAYADRAAVKD
ncbi:MAG TPA: AAA family ATPase [Thermoleophilaceae bacterium]